LQPTVGILNDAVNLKDRKAMREFCANYEQIAIGTEIVNLLLNERYDGLRFWSLLKMAYVDVESEKYIFAVQTPLAVYMPKALRARVESKQQNEEIVKALPVFSKRLNDLRDGLEERTGESIFELASFASTTLDALDGAKGKKGDKTGMAAMKSKVGGRKMTAPANVKTDELVLRFLSVKGLTTPVPNKSIPVRAGRGCNVHVDNPEYTAMFAVLSMEQYQSVQKIRIALDLVPKGDGEPMLMVTVVQDVVRIDDVPARQGSTQPVKCGSTIEFGDAFVLRVSSLKSKLAHDKK